VVFLHGWCLSELAWRSQKARLRLDHGAPLRLISIDHRGHGRSDPAPLHTCRIEQLADDLAVVLTELNVRGPVTLVGHSMGAMVALEYALRPQGQRPVDPGGLVLVAAAAGKLAQRGLGKLLNTPATAALVTALAHTPEHLLRITAGPVCAAVGRYCRCGRTERATVSALATAALATTPLTTAIGFLPSLRDWDRTDALGDVRARTVVVSGGNDLLTPVAHAEELAAGIPGASHLHVPEAAHMLPQHPPEVLQHALRAVISAPSVAPLTASPPAAVLRRAHA
jgi:pimeloyl-ACP methyl ester carboxylesterase